MFNALRVNEPLTNLTDSLRHSVNMCGYLCLGQVKCKASPLGRACIPSYFSPDAFEPGLKLLQVISPNLCLKCPRTTNQAPTLDTKREKMKEFHLSFQTPTQFMEGICNPEFTTCFCNYGNSVAKTTSCVKVFCTKASISSQFSTKQI